MKLKSLWLTVVGTVAMAAGTTAAAQQTYQECINQVCPPSIPSPYRQMCIDSTGYTQCAALPGGPAYTGSCHNEVDQACLNNLCPPSIPSPYRQYCLESPTNISACTVQVCD